MSEQNLPSQRTVITLLVLVTGLGMLVGGMFSVAPPTKLVSLSRDSKFRQTLLDLEKEKKLQTQFGSGAGHTHAHGTQGTQNTGSTTSTTSTSTTGSETTNPGSGAVAAGGSDGGGLGPSDPNHHADGTSPDEKPDPCSVVFFATPKGLEPLLRVTQMNALRSWAHLKPRPRKILLFLQRDHEEWRQLTKDYPGMFKILEIQKTNQNGTPFLNDLFHRAQDPAVNESPGARVFALVNSDIILLPEFGDVVSQVCNEMNDFLIIGKRTNTPKAVPNAPERTQETWPEDKIIDFTLPGWDTQIRAYAKANGEDFIDAAQDYFVFSKGIYDTVQPFLVGRMVWDNWLVQHVTHNRPGGNVAVDASQSVLAVHQTHDYSHLKDGPDPHQGEEKAWNLNVGNEGGYDAGFISAAKYVIEPAKIAQTKWDSRPRKFVIREK